MGDECGSALRVLHIFRSPKGGLFRHVCDLAERQKESGLKVGVICAEGDPEAQARLEKLAGDCELGLHQISMGRLPGFGDVAAMIRIAAMARELSPQILHGHGAKGGAYARLLPCPKGGARIYTPHGGSLHFDAGSLQGRAFFMLERMLRYRTEGFIFESEFARRTFEEKIGATFAPSLVVRNGLRENEFLPVEADGPMADFVFVGEIRELKGIGTLIEAADLLKRPVHLRIIGDGPDLGHFRSMAKNAARDVRIELIGPMPARNAFAQGRIVVLPSHHESLPYVALEAGAAGKPLIATRVGGIPEIFGADSNLLVEPRNASVLAETMRKALDDPSGMERAAKRLQARLHHEFSLGQMADRIGAFYRELCAASMDARQASSAGVCRQVSP